MKQYNNVEDVDILLDKRSLSRKTLDGIIYYLSSN